MTRAAESPYKGETGLKRVLSATRNSLAGLTEALRHEDAFRKAASGNSNSRGRRRMGGHLRRRA
jgi:hypothetical protein